MTLPRSSAVGVQTRTRPDVRLKANLRRERGNATPLPLRARGRPDPRIQMQRYRGSATALTSGFGVQGLDIPPSPSS